VGFPWPAGFERVPDEDWARRPLEELALKYDSVEQHGWYDNLDPTLDELERLLAPGALVLDYSGGTGILVDRLLRRRPDLDAGFVIVDASPKFLRLAKEKFADDERVAFRWIRYLKPERRLQLLDEVLPRGLRADVLVSTNAIHLYYDLPDTLRSWARVLRPGAPALVQSGNIDNPARGPDEWIIDRTVEAIHEEAIEIVREDDRYAAYRGVLDDAARLDAHRVVREKFFLPIRPLAYYVEALEAAGLHVESVTTRPIAAKVEEWYEFLAVYHEGVLGWLGGTARVEGQEPGAAAVADRLRLMREAMARLFSGPTFDAAWTYVTATAHAHAD